LTSKTVSTSCPYSPKYVEGKFSEVRLHRILGSPDAATSRMSRSGDR
jgi:hypothetical protein